MSALNFARQAFGREKPHSSITDWVDILTSSNIAEEAYDGIPELVDSINLQASGPAEASRAIRKKLKHGNSHQQFRALVLLKALVENGGQKFQTSFADGHMTDALKHLSNDSTADKRVKKKLLLVLGSWRDQYKDDPSMSVVAGLHKQCRGESRRIGQVELSDLMGLHVEENKQTDKEAKKKAKLEKERQAKKEEEDRRKKKRVPFDFEKEKPKVLSSIVEASQASSNLVNAITLVNPATDSLETNERVQECLEKAKLAGKPVVRYIRLVENDEVIGTLIETNDRIVAALEMYEKLVIPSSEPGGDKVAFITAGLAATTLPPSTSGAGNNQAKGKDQTVEPLAHVYADLEDITFDSLGSASNNLPAPLRPSAALSDDDYEQTNVDQRGSLSEFSDYESSDEETHKANVGSSSKRNYVTVSDNEDNTHLSSGPSRGTKQVEGDPFADPFADS